MRSIVVGTAGHIDHGKSALVHALTGTDPDRLKEEKARGITIDLGFAHAVIDGITFAFVDVPGHERFVKNMLAGATGIDLLILIVAADESVMPQTREHFDICRLLRVPTGVVALTKADLADADMTARARRDVSELVEGSFLEGVPIVPVSARSGEGLDALRAALAACAGRLPLRAQAGVMRLPIDRAFTIKGFGPVVTGTLVSGRVAVDDTLALLPGDARVGVRGVHVHGQVRTDAVAGERTAVNVTGIDIASLSRGQTLATPGAFTTTRLADAIVDLLPTAKPLKHGARVRFHQGTTETLGRVAIVGPTDADSGVPVIAPGRRAFVRLRLEAPAVLVRGDRYVLRAYSPPMTIAGGLVLDPEPPRSAIRTVAALERCRRLAFEPDMDRSRADGDAVRAMVEEAGAAGMSIATLTTRAGIDPAERERVVNALVGSGDVVRVDDTIVAAAVYTKLLDAIIAALTAHHAAQPLADGLARDDLRGRMFGHGRSAAFDHALDNLAATGRVVARDRVALATHRPELSADEAGARTRIERRYLDAALTPPDAAAIAAAAQAPADVTERLLKLLQRQKVLMRVDTLWFHEEVLRQLKDDVVALKAAGVVRLDVAVFKERFGVTRKFAIPLLEYLDRERVTRRVGDSRVIL
jgi:selenocysteine-specific elongation factor